jgi:shikimate dehydrogenase
LTKRVVLIGSPVSESLSLVLQQAAFDAAGLDVRYELWDRRPIELPEAIEELRADDFLGASVTIPHKERVVPMIDRLTEEARDTGAVDTITKDGPRLVGHNTDVPAFRVVLDKLVGKQKMPKSAVVIGAGGGARAVVYGLITEGFQRVVVFNRHLHRAERLVKHFSRMASHMELRAMTWHESVIEAELAKTKVVVNASSVGMVESETPVPAELIPADLLVLDLIYSVPQTRFLREAAAAGCQTMNGDFMLVQQSAAAFTLWTGLPAPLQVMQERLDAARRQSGPPPSEGAQAGSASLAGEKNGAEAETAEAKTAEEAGSTGTAESRADEPALSEATRT